VNGSFLVIVFLLVLGFLRNFEGEEENEEDCRIFGIVHLGKHARPSVGGYLR
jgi:hypothetical protein